MISIEALHLCRGVAWLVCVVYTPSPPTRRIGNVLTVRRAARSSSVGCCQAIPSPLVSARVKDGAAVHLTSFTFRLFKHIQAVVVVQHGTLEEDA
jgi:hypothetical protein